MTQFFENSIEKPRLVIPYKSYQKIMAYADLADGEISGFADVEWDNDEMALKLGEVYLLKQEAGGADVEMDADTVADFNYQMIKMGKTQLPRVWWHSHHIMDVFFSGTDVATIQELTNDTFMLAIVVNQHHELRTCLKICQPIPMVINDLPLTVDYGFEKIPEALRREVQQKVKSKGFRLFGRFDKTTESKEVKKNEKGDDTSMVIDGDGFEARSFPKKKKEIKKTIRSHDLVIKWDFSLKCYVWVDYKKNIKYIDTHEVIDNVWSKEWSRGSTN